MKNLLKIFALCYGVDLILFYALLFLREGKLLSGIYKTRMDIFYDHAYFFILIIVCLNIWLLKMARSADWKNAWYNWIFYGTLSYILFIAVSVSFVGFSLNMRGPEFSISKFLIDFKRIFIEALVIGFLMILFSPITYLITLNHWLVIRILSRKDNN